MPTANDKEFIAKLKELESHCIAWISVYEANYVDVGEPHLHGAKDHILYLHSLTRAFEKAADFDTLTGSRSPEDRYMIDLLEDNVVGQVDYMEFLMPYLYSGRNADLVQEINNIKTVEAPLRLFDSTIEWIRDAEDRW